MEITTMDELWEKAIVLNTDELLESDSSCHFKKLVRANWQNMPGKTFNTENGVLVFTDDNASIYVIPNFSGLTQLLKANGFRQNYLMPVPLSDNFSPRIHKSYWQSLKLEFRQQYA